jgi:hypothetical protein
VLQCIGVTPGAAPAATLGEHAGRWRTPIAAARDKTLLERDTAVFGLYHALVLGGACNVPAATAVRKACSACTMRSGPRLDRRPDRGTMQPGRWDPSVLIFAGRQLHPMEADFSAMPLPSGGGKSAAAGRQSM